MILHFVTETLLLKARSYPVPSVLRSYSHVNILQGAISAHPKLTCRANTESSMSLRHLVLWFSVCLVLLPDFFCPALLFRCFPCHSLVSVSCFTVIFLPSCFYSLLVSSSPTNHHPLGYFQSVFFHCQLSFRGCLCQCVLHASWSDAVCQIQTLWESLTKPRNFK